MFRKTKLYPCMAVVLAVICFIFLSNCGGGGNSSVVPNTNPTTDEPVSYTNPTPTPVLSNVNVSGYLYVNNTVTEDGETIPCINVIDVPAYQADSLGNEPFVKQVANSLQQDYPEDWAKAEIQELYAQLNKTLSESKPLPECNGQVSSVYSESPIPVGSDGHFDNTVLTGATDSNVKLEVALGEDNYAEVETLPTSGSINSSDATSAAVLKSCPEKIFAFPGEILIFKVYSEPGINLKSAGLRFTLNNTSIGCIVQPLYLCLFGAHKYQVAYGCVYIKPGLDTPVDTTINAKLNSGHSMSIFLEVIKKTASVSGTVYTGGSPLVKGYVKSLGPKACCKIDASGNYSLPKVFRGHSRSVIATWWTSENGQKIRHREEKVIDFLSGDVTGFNFGVPPTPTPTCTPSVTPTRCDPTSSKYDFPVSKVIRQFHQLESEVGTSQAIQNTVNWINNKNSNDDSLAPEEIKEAHIDESDANNIWIKFLDGYSVCLGFGYGEEIMLDENESISSQNYNESSSVYPSSNYILSSSNVITPSSNKILMLHPFHYEAEKVIIHPDKYASEVYTPIDPNIYYSDPNTFINSFYNNLFCGKLADDLIQNNYDVHRVVTRGREFGSETFAIPTNILEDIPESSIVITDYTINYVYLKETLETGEVRYQLNLIGADMEHQSTPQEQLDILLTYKDRVFNSYEEFSRTLSEAGLLDGNIKRITPVLCLKPGIPPIDKQISQLRHILRRPGYEKNIVTIDDYLQLNEYGVIGIITHSSPRCILAGIIYENDPNTADWIRNHKEDFFDNHDNPSGTWFVHYQVVKDVPYAHKTLALMDNFFARQSYNNSIVYLGGCTSLPLANAFINNGAKVFIGNTDKSRKGWEEIYEYKFFYNMMYGKDTTDKTLPMSAYQAFKTISDIPNPDKYYCASDNKDIWCEKRILPDRDDNVYFPVPLDIWIQKND